MAVESLSMGSVSGDYSQTPNRVYEVPVAEAAVEKAVEKKEINVEESEAYKLDDGDKKKQTASPSSMEEAVKRANNRMSKTHCEFSYNNEVNRVSITVFDDETGEVIREIPPEESLKMLEKMWEITGLMVDERK